MGEKKEKIVLYSYLVIIALLIVIRFAMLDIVQSENFRLNQLRDEINKQHSANLQLQEQLLHQESFQYIATQAKKRGFSGRLP